MCCLQTITAQYLQQLSTGMRLSLSPNQANKTGTMSVEQIKKVLLLPSLVTFDSKTGLHSTRLLLAVLPTAQLCASHAQFSISFNMTVKHVRQLGLVSAGCPLGASV